MERIILDVDTGLDDAVAIVLASALPSVEIEGIVAVSGNIARERTLENTLDVCDLLGISAPVYPGSDRPLLREAVHAGEFHGKTGLDGPVFGPREKQASEGNGVRFIVDTVMANPHEITLVALGPLTDIALALRLEPQVARLARQIVSMGGSFCGGNVTEAAEFNAYADPEAAQIVFSSGASVVMFPLDCTMQVRLGKERLAAYHRMGRKAAGMVAACMDTYMDNYTRLDLGLPVLHDPLCVAYLADPEMFGLHEAHVTVELRDRSEYGRTIATDSLPEDRVKIAKEVDPSRFWAMLDDALLNLR
jgi:ribosylpyrimidine nucleosidase